MSTKAAVLERLLDLAWAQWTALGVAGAVQPATEPVDLESLMILTADLSSADPRLRDEALDWCSQFHSYSSKPRLKQLLRRAPPSAQSAFETFANLLGWHIEKASPRVFKEPRQRASLSGKSRLPPLTHPALLSLRLRALFGVGARADIVGAILCSSFATVGASDLVYVGYTKRNIADALDALAAADLLRAMREGNRIRFSWQRHAQLSALLDPLPHTTPVWSSRMRAMSALLALATRMQGKSDRLAAVEAALCFRDLGDELLRLAIAVPQIATTMTSAMISKHVIDTIEALVCPVSLPR